MKTANASSRPVLLALMTSLIFTPMGWGDAPLVKPAAPVAPLATTEQAIDQRLEGKFFILRGFYQDEKLEFDTNGKIVGAPEAGSFALSALEVKKVRSTKHSIIIEADRIGLHFFGGLPYEDDNQPFERIKVSKKPIEITIDRLVIEPEKKKKKEKEAKEAAKTAAAKAAAKPAPGAAPASATTAGTGTPAATTVAATSGVANPPDVTFEDTDAKAAAPATTDATTATPAAPTPATGDQTDLTAKAAPATIAKAPVDPVHHDPAESWKQLSKALDVVFAPGLDDSVISTLPEYWQNYFATKEGKIQAARIDNSVLRPGNGIVSPKLLSVLDPQSNDYAQKNNIAGMTLLSTVVGASGKPGSVTIVRPIGFGLDEQAVAAVEHAKFRPGMRDGQAVPVEVNLQVTFRIYSDRTRPEAGGPPQPAASQPATATPVSNPTPSHGNSNGKEVAVVSQK